MKNNKRNKHMLKYIQEQKNIECCVKELNKIILKTVMKRQYIH